MESIDDRVTYAHSIFPVARSLKKTKQALELVANVATELARMECVRGMGPVLDVARRIYLFSGA